MPPKYELSPITDRLRQTWNRYTGTLPNAWAKVDRFLPPAIVILVTVLSLRSFLNARLVKHDHPIHLFKAWQFWTELLSHGRLVGWSNNWYYGYPASELVPPGGELWIAAARILTLGQLDWNHTYKFAYLALAVFSALASYALASKYFGRWAGAISGCLFILDPGAMYQGGWVWTTEFGVWPIVLSLSFTSFAVVKLEDILAEPGKRRHLVLASFYLFASIIAHQIALILIAIVAPLLLLDNWLRGPRDPKWVWATLLPPFAFGVGLAGFFLLPFLARGSMTLDWGALGTTAESWAPLWAELRLFQNNSPIIIGLSILGALLALRLRRSGGVLLTLGLLGSLVFATDVLITVLHLERALPGLVKIEFGRMVMSAKIFAYPLAGFGAVSALTLGQRDATHVSLARKLVPWVIVTAAFAPFLPAFAKNNFDRFVNKDYRLTIDRGLLRSYDAFTTWAREKRTETSEHYRIAYFAHDMITLTAMAPQVTNTPAYLAFTMPSQQFDRYTCSREPAVLETMGVKYVVSQGPLTDSYYSLEKDFGALKVYKFKPFKSDPFTVIGPGHAELLTWETELLRIQLTDTDPSTQLKLHIARHDRWEATLDGRVLPIRPATVEGHEHPFLMQVPATNGVVELRYVRRGIDWAGLILTLFSSLALVGFVFSPRERGKVATLVQAVQLREKYLLGALLAAGAGAIALLVVRASTRQHLLPAASIFHAVTGNELTLDGESCVKRGPLYFKCGTRTVEAAYTLTAGRYHLCMSAAQGTELLVSTSLTLGSTLQFPTSPADETGNISVRVNDTDLGSVRNRYSATDVRNAQFDTSAFAGQPNSKLELRISGGGVRCFDARVLP